jgi:hypothetical protein
MESTNSQTAPAKPKTLTAPPWVEYVATIVVNIIMLVVVNNLLRWDILPFLTGDFNLVLWLINLSLSATIAINLAFIFYSQDWFKSLGRAVLSAISLALGIRMLQVFPFDFSMYESTVWTGLVRGLIIFTIVVVSIALLAELVKFAVALAARK